MLHVQSGRLSAVLALTALTACSDAPAIVENATPAWGDSLTWTIGATPALIAGRQPEDLEALLSTGDVARTSHGRIAAAVQAIDQLRIYDPAGALAATAGGLDTSLLHAIGQVWIRPGDTIVVASARPPALHFFDADGRNTGNVELTANTLTSFVRPIAQFTDGSILTQSLVPGAVLPDLGEHLQDTLAFIRFSPDGDTATSIARVAGARQLVFNDGGGKRQIAAPFPLTASGTAAGDDLVVGNGESHEFSVIGQDGRVRRIIRWDAPPVRVTSEVRQQYRRSAIGDTPAPRVAEVFDSFTRQAGFPDVMPAYTAIAVDEVGGFWLRAYTPPWALDDPETWIVFDPAGRWLGSLTLPAFFRATRFGGSWVLGVLDSPAGYRQLALFTLNRTPARRPPPATPSSPPGSARHSP